MRVRVTWRDSGSLQADPAMANESMSCRVDVTASNEGQSLLYGQAPLSAWGRSVAGVERRDEEGRGWRWGGDGT